MQVQLLDVRAAGCLRARGIGLPDQENTHLRDPSRRGLTVATPGNLVWRSGRSRLRQKKGAIERLRKEPPAHSATLDIDEMGPVSAKSYPGQEAIKVTARP